jgi:hypothetical protein
MARQIRFILSDSGAITAFANNKSYTVAPDHPSYTGIVQAIKDDDVAKLESLGDVAKSVQDFTKGKMEVRNGQVYYSGQELHNSMTDRLLNLMRSGFPFEPMLAFIENLMENPSRRAIKELYSFLQNRGLPLTDDGCFLAYKSIRSDWTDWHTGTIDNHIGCSPSMPRNLVDDDFGVNCSEGYHVGAMDYVRDFHREEGKIVLVKINPKDVVSVPSDERCTKCRVSQYSILEELSAELFKPLYTASSPVAPLVPVGGDARLEDNWDGEGDEDWDNDNDWDRDEDEDEGGW